MAEDTTEEFIPGAAAPSDAQKSAGNYRKGHRMVAGMRVSIENAAGTTRSGKDKDGNPWTSTLMHDYGYVRGSKGKDKDSVDVWLGPNHNDPDAKIFVIDQHNDDGALDEHKAMLGFDDMEHAASSYLSNYPTGWKGLGAITEMSLPEFRKWVYKGKEGGKRARVSDLVEFRDRAVRPNDSYAGGGAVGKAAVRLAEILKQHGVEGVLPRIQEMVDRTNRTGNETSVMGWVGNEGAANPQRGFVGKQPQMIEGDKESVRIARPDYMDRNDRLAFLTAHSHPAESTPVPSDKDMLLANAISGYGKDNKFMVVQQGRDRIGHSTIDLPGDAFENSPVTNPRNVNAITDILRDAQRKGYYDTYLRDAYIDPARNSWRIPAMRNYMAGALWEPEGMARYAHDIPTVGRIQHEQALGRGEPGTFYSDDPEVMNRIINATWGPTESLLRDNFKRLEFAEGGAVPDCGCGGHKGYAEGGAVDDDLSRPAFRTPMVAKRREDRQDREGAKQAPLGLLRGALAGTLGFGGDIEGVIRGLAHAANGKTDTTPVLPTSDFYRDVLPAKPTSAAGKAFEEVGNAAGVPLSGAALGGVRLAKRALPEARGALSAISERLAATPEPLMAGRPVGGERWRQTGAIKNPGGNWWDPHYKVAEHIDETDEATNAIPKEMGPSANRMAGEEADARVEDWMEKRWSDYMAKQMGTVNDPLLALEREGRLHLKPEQLEHGRAAEVPHDTTGEIHKMLTGRDTRTPWEHRTDSLIERHSAKTLPDTLEQYGLEDLSQADFLAGSPDWVKKLYAGEDTAHALFLPRNDAMEASGDLSRALGMDHVKDYLNQATDAFNQAQLYGRQGFEGTEGRRVQQLLDAGLDIDPDKLARMSLADVVGKTADWNKAMDKWAEEARLAKDWNKGVKSVMKDYGDGRQWVELEPSALADEGEAMGHCVGGYCSSVESGAKRIFSLRDKNGPHITVEAAKPSARDYMRVYDEDFAAPMLNDPELQKSFSDWMTGPQFQEVVRNAGGALGENRAYDVANMYLAAQGKPPLRELPYQIRQIKGKGNLAPIDEYKPYAQDLVRNMGPWAENIGDLQFTGLSDINSRLPFTDDYLKKHFGVVRPKERLFANYDEMLKALEDANPDVQVPPDLADIIRRGYCEGGSVERNYAAGGSVIGEQTVGLGTYAPSAQGRAAPGAANGLSSPQLSLSGGGTQPSSTPNIGSMMAGMGMFGKQDFTGIPTWNVNDPDAAAQIKAYTSGANAGTDLRGISAFMRGWSPTTWTGQGGDVDTRREEVNPDAQHTLAQMAQLAGMDPWSMAGTNFQDAGQVNQLYKDIDSRLQDYRFISGLQPGQSGLKTYETIYKQGADGQLNPIWARDWARPEDHGWAKGESGGSFLRAVSMMLPAVGGWAGLAGQTAGTTGAALANTAGNAAMGYLQGGGQGALSSLLGSGGGYLGGAAGQYLGGAGGQSAGQQLGSYFGKKAAERV